MVAMQDSRRVRLVVVVHQVMEVHLAVGRLEVAAEADFLQWFPYLLP